MYPAIAPQCFSKSERHIQGLLLSVITLQRSPDEPLFVAAFPLSFSPNRAVIIRRIANDNEARPTLVEQALDFVEHRDLDLQVFLDRGLQTMLSLALIIELLEVRWRGYADIDFDRLGHGAQR
jgi:hypothetical protein